MNKCFGIGLILVSSSANMAVAGTKVSIETSMGNIVVELEDEKAPVTVANFLSYVDSGFYTGTIFHRVIDGFMIQGGGFTTDVRRKQTKASIPLEAGLSNTRGTIAMARSQNPNSASSQFFINLVDNTQLDTYGGGYAVFGQVVSGMETVDSIGKVKTRRARGQQNLPVVPVQIQSITRLPDGPAIQNHEK